MMKVRLVIMTSISKNRMTVSFTDYHRLATWLMRDVNYRLIGKLIAIEEIN